MGLQGKGEIENEGRERKRIQDFPLPLLQQCRSLAWVEVGRRLCPGYGSSEGHVTTNVEMVSDEVFCWLPNNGNWQWRPAATSFIAQHAMFENRVSSRGTCFASKRILR